MSSRQLRNALASREPKSVDEEDGSDIDEETTTPSKNLFDMLGDEESADPHHDSDESEEPPSHPTPQTKASPSSSTGKSSKNKKSKKGKQQEKKKKQQENIDVLIQKYAAPSEHSASPSSSSSSPSSSSSSAFSRQQSIFCLDSKYLNAELELIKLFGKKTIREMTAESNVRRQRSALKKVFFLIRPKENWPPIPPGIRMDFVTSAKGLDYFRIVWTPEYKRAQERFFECVASYNPASFQYVLQQFHPYHVDTLLQLSEYLKQTGEYDTAMDFIERTVYVFESSWHSQFNPFNGNCRLDYAIEENRTFFLSLFRHIQILGREGCNRTALEYCKLLLGLDPRDPLRVLLIIDTYALRSREYLFLFKLTQSEELLNIPPFPTTASSTSSSFSSSSSPSSAVSPPPPSSSNSPSTLTSHNFNVLPNFAYSLALAKFHLEQNSVNVDAPSSSSLLQKAIFSFPSLIPSLCKKNSITVAKNNKYLGTASQSDFVQHSFFSQASSSVSPILKQLLSLYVERNFALWREQHVVSWLKENIALALNRVEAGDVEVRECAQEVEEQYVKNPMNIYNHLVLSEYTESLPDVLPPDLVNAIRHGGGGPQIYETYHQPREPVVHATTNNPFQLFLQTLMPWNPVPNAPPVGTTLPPQQQPTDNQPLLGNILDYLAALQLQEEEEEELDEQLRRQAEQ